jgi:hypothetical protein
VGKLIIKVEHRVHPEVIMLNTKESMEQEIDKESTMVLEEKVANLEKT